MEQKLYQSHEVLKTLSQNDRTTVHLFIDANTGEKRIAKYMKGNHDVYESLKDLKHLLLPKIYQVEFTNDQTIVVEEYIDGVNIAEAFLSEKQIVRAFLELCKVLEILHDKNILHRDIKPSNILIAPDHHIRLIDFDAARVANDESESDTQLLGTKGYAPPEQYGFSQTDNRSDIYSAGITIRTLLGPSARKYRYRKLIKKCTAIDPKKRYRSVAHMRNSIYVSRFNRFVVIPILCIAMAFSVWFMYGFLKTPLAVSDFKRIIAESGIFYRSDLFSNTTIDFNRKYYSYLDIEPKLGGDTCPDFSSAYTILGEKFPDQQFIYSNVNDKNKNYIFGGFYATYGINDGILYYNEFVGLYLVNSETGSILFYPPEKAHLYTEATNRLYNKHAFAVPLF